MRVGEGVKVWELRVGGGGETILVVHVCVCVCVNSIVVLLVSYINI